MSTPNLERRTSNGLILSFGMRLILASASPRRSELLRAAGFSFDTRPVDVDESTRANETADAYVRRLASDKSAYVAQLLEAEGKSADAIVLGADTAVVIDGTILGKPASTQEARAMLARLSGRSHHVVTAVSLRSAAGNRDGIETTEVWFSSLTADDIDWYISTGEGADKAGGYAIQGLASRFTPRIAGSYSNVVGLPISLVHRLLVESGNR
jgi:septum formation protein